jgi:hypothetical protein
MHDLSHYTLKSSGMADMQVWLGLAVSLNTTGSLQRKPQDISQPHASQSLQYLRYAYVIDM